MVTTQNRAVSVVDRLKDLKARNGTKWVLDRINRTASPISYPYSKAHMSYWCSGKRSIPDHVQSTINHVWFELYTPIGPMMVEVTSGPVAWVQSLMQQPVPDMEVALDMATRLYRSCENNERETKARLGALTGILYRMKGDIAEAEYWFSLARADAPPHLVKRYTTNLLSIRREKLDRAKAALTSADHEAGLREIYEQQKKILGKPIAEHDEYLALQHCLRLTSELNDEEAFGGHLKTARMHKGFGKTPNERDKSLLVFFALQHDEDGDFTNARGSFKCYLEFVRDTL